MRPLIRSLTHWGRFARRRGFTLIELLTVMTIIAILAGLILSISGYATKKGALSRAAGEIKALEEGCERYKADNGIYPHQPLALSGSIPAIVGTGTNDNIPSDTLSPMANGNSVIVTTSSTPYMSSSLELYEALTSDVNCTGTGGGVGTTNYIADMKPDVFGRSNMTASISSSNLVIYLSDPFGNSYGYSTAYASTIVATGSAANPPNGYNPTFDLWSTGGATSAPYNQTSGGKTPGSPGDPMLQWVKNW